MRRIAIRRPVVTLTGMLGAWLVIGGVARAQDTVPPGNGTAVAPSDPAVSRARAVATPERFPRLAATPATPEQGKTVRAIAVDLWVVHNQQKVERLDVSGLVLCELRAGVRMTTVIDGKREVRHEGDHWLVAPGQSMGIETDRYAVVIQTTSLP
jgi:hypothetical protein